MQNTSSLIMKYINIYSSQFNLQLTEDLCKEWLNELSCFNYITLENALSAANRTCKFAPKLADILAFLPSKLQHPKPHRAYAIMPKGEMVGGYVTDQMVQAWCDAKESENEYQRNKAFIESYELIMNSCEASSIPAKFYYSAPCNVHGEAARQMKIDLTVKAHNDGLISMKQSIGVILDCKRIDDPCYYEENTVQTCRVLTGARSPIVRGLVKEIENDETLMIESANKPHKIEKGDEED